MAWNFCADPEFQHTLDCLTTFVANEDHPLEPLLPQLSAQAAAHLPKELGGNGFGQLPLAHLNLITFDGGVSG
jgi:acyl-CoA dehydrogenase